MTHAASSAARALSDEDRAVSAWNYYSLYVNPKYDFDEERLRKRLKSQFALTGEWPLPPVPMNFTQPSSDAQTSEGTGPAATPDSATRSALDEAQARWAANPQPLLDFLQMVLPGFGLQLLSQTRPAPATNQGKRPSASTAASLAPSRQQMVASLTREDHLAKFTDSESPYYPYFVEAGRLLAAKESVIDKELLSDCRRALALLIALFYFPLFRSMGGRTGQWVTIGLNRMRDELGMNSQRLRAHDQQKQKSVIAALVQVGLIQVTTVEPSTGIIPATQGRVSRAEFDQLRADCSDLNQSLGGGRVGYWTRRSIQKNNAFYRLGAGIRLSEGLPEFNPFDLESGVIQKWNSIIRANESAYSEIIRLESYKNQSSIRRDMNPLASISLESALNQSSEGESGQNKADSSPININNLNNLTNNHATHARENELDSDVHIPLRANKVRDLSQEEKSAFALLYRCRELVGQQGGFDFKTALILSQKHDLEEVRAAIQQARADFIYRKQNMPGKATRDNFTGLVHHNLKKGGALVPPTREEQEELVQIAREEFSKLVSVERSSIYDSVSAGRNGKGENQPNSGRPAVARNGKFTPASASYAQATYGNDDDDEHFQLR